MIRVILNGCNGKMGRVLVRMLEAQKDMEIVAGIDRETDRYENSFPVYADIFSCSEKGDVLIDFSHPSTISNTLNYCQKSNVPIVTATTGLSGKDTAHFLEASKSIPIFQSSNMSLGISIVIDIAAQAAKTLGDSFDIEIIEKHHNKKVDSPSGTAFMIADGINKTFEHRKEYIYGRHGNEDVRSENQIGIHAVRGGTIFGEHTVIFAGSDEIIEIKHTALSKDIFAAGAINAARFIIQQKSGYYNMHDLLKEA